VYNAGSRERETESIVLSTRWVNRPRLLILCAELLRRASAQWMSGFFVALGLRSVQLRSLSGGGNVTPADVTKEGGNGYSAGFR
jgi:hypothetical protein